MARKFRIKRKLPLSKPFPIFTMVCSLLDHSSISIGKSYQKTNRSHVGIKSMASNNHMTNKREEEKNTYNYYYYPKPI